MTLGPPNNSVTLEELLPSWRRALKAANKAPRTIQSYFLAAGQLVAYLHDNDMSTIATEVTHREIQGYLAHMFETRAPATARQRYASLQQLFKWLQVEEEIESNPFNKIAKPRISEEPVPVIPTPDLAALIKACSGKEFDDLRDAALIRTLTNTGMRLGELVGMTFEDVDLDRAEVSVTGKGNKTRMVALGDNTIVSLDRYLRARRRHRLAGLSAVWLGLRGPLTNSGVAQIIARRADQAGLGRIHPHQFRHTFAHEWLRAGGGETDLMRLMGWDSPQMLRRYGASAGSERAREAQRRLGVGDHI